MNGGFFLVDISFRSVECVPRLPPPWKGLAWTSSHRRDFVAHGFLVLPLPRCGFPRILAEICRGVLGAGSPAEESRTREERTSIATEKVLPQERRNFRDRIFRLLIVGNGVLLTADTPTKKENSSVSFLSSRVLLSVLSLCSFRPPPIQIFAGSCRCSVHSSPRVHVLTLDNVTGRP